MPSAVKNGKIHIDFAVGKADNPKVNAILIVEGGLKNTHYQAHDRYIRELDKIRRMQQKQRQDEYDQEFVQPFSATIDFFADDEDPSLPKTQFNSLLEGPYTLEAFSIGFLFVFFSVLRILSSENEKAKIKIAKIE